MGRCFGHAIRVWRILFGFTVAAQDPTDLEQREAGQHRQRELHHRACRQAGVADFKHRQRDDRQDHHEGDRVHVEPCGFTLLCRQRQKRFVFFAGKDPFGHPAEPEDKQANQRQQFNDLCRACAQKTRLPCRDGQQVEPH